MRSSREIGKHAFFELLNGESANNVAEALNVFLTERNLRQLLPDIIRHVERELEESKKQDVVKIISSHDLSTKLQNEIRNSIDAEDAEIETSVDPQIISGFIARYKGRLFDASGKRQLESLKNKLIA